MRLPRAIPARQVVGIQYSHDEYPPDWLNSLQEVLDRKAFVENSDEGPIVYIYVWFVHGGYRQTK